MRKVQSAKVRRRRRGIRDEKKGQRKERETKGRKRKPGEGRVVAEGRPSNIRANDRATERSSVAVMPPLNMKYFPMKMAIDYSFAKTLHNEYSLFVEM